MKPVEELNYSEFVSLINERNRPSGGIKTVQEIVINARLNEKSKILEIGSNTGFTSVNIGLLTNADVIGIDMLQDSVDKAKKYAVDMAAKNVKFICGNALDLPFEDEIFDLIWCSNVTSFINDKERAILEYLRVLKPNGLLALVPIYYRTTPPQSLVDEVSNAIGCKVQNWNKQFWLDLFSSISTQRGVSLEVIYSKDYRYIDQHKRLDDYIETVLSAPEKGLTTRSDYPIIKQRAKYFYQLFNENNAKYAGYSVILLQKRKMSDEPELFLSEEV